MRAGGEVIKAGSISLRSGCKIEFAEVLVVFFLFFLSLYFSNWEFIDASSL